MFQVPRLTDKATTNDDLPASGQVLAESLDLCRKDSANVNRFLEACMKKLQNENVQVRIKSLKFLLHLAQHGPPSFSKEIKLYSANISGCMGWRGAPHPVRGYGAYTEMKDIAQQVLDLCYIEQPKQEFVVKGTVKQQGTGVYQVESYGSEIVIDNSKSLESRDLNPNKFDPIEKAKELLHIKKSTPSGGKYGGVNNTGQFFLPPMEESYNIGSNKENAQYPVQAPPSSFNDFDQAPRQSQFSRIEQPVTNWKEKKPELAPRYQGKSNADVTAVSKLLKIYGGAAPQPSNKDLNIFLQGCVGESIDELEAALAHSDWKVRLRAVYGLEVCGQKFSLGSIAHLRNKLGELAKSAQASLRNISNKVYLSLENVTPTGVPKGESAFDFGPVEETQEKGFSFAEENNEAATFSFGGEEEKNAEGDIEDQTNQTSEAGQ